MVLTLWRLYIYFGCPKCNKSCKPTLRVIDIMFWDMCMLGIWFVTIFPCTCVSKWVFPYLEGPVYTIVVTNDHDHCYLKALVGWEMSILFYTRSPRIKVPLGEHVRKWMKSDANPACLEMDIVWWSPGFCDKRIQIGCLNGKQGRPCQRKLYIIII